MTSFLDGHGSFQSPKSSPHNTWLLLAAKAHYNSLIRKVSHLGNDLCRLQCFSDPCYPFYSPAL